MVLVITMVKNKEKHVICLCGPPLLADPTLEVLVLEPFQHQLTRWEVVVVDSLEFGPVALMPSEVEWYSTDGEMLAHQLALAEWQMMRVSGWGG